MERKPIDRDKTCPFLIRLLWRENEYLTPDCMRNRNEHQGPDEIRLYGWRDTNFREIADMLKEHISGARRKDADFNFSFIRQNLEGGYEVKTVGTIHFSRKSDLDSVTLHQLKFVIGDFIVLNLTYSLT
ncbi:hypothetical protein SteCoe_28017 [Stentor coeruleus]|uniref:Uncharacterized protein n=1 Tax=Stentor coeruleus TaxID=5963 RepID=A0A1R2B9E0_9CILI|nr:hypothetical protein SteCoe_28017 [Stentor coeruleus]